MIASTCHKPIRYVGCIFILLNGTKIQIDQKRLFINVLLIVSSQPASLNSLHMFKKWAKLCLCQFVPYTYEMRIKEKKCFTFVFAATISLFKSRLKTFLLS